MKQAISFQHKLLLMVGIMLLWILFSYIEYSPVVFGLLFLFSISYLLSITGFRIVSFLMIAALPFSINHEFAGSGIDMRIPSEFLITIIAVAFGLQKTLISSLNQQVLKHPVTRLLIVFLVIQLITSFFSSMPMVSAKAIVIKILYITVFYFAFAEMFANDFSNIKKSLMAYLVTLTGVVIFTIHHHSKFDYNKSYTSYMPLPFFSDHTIYSACVVFFIPVAAIYTYRAKEWFGTRAFSFLFFLITALLLLAVFLSASRAAWLSILVMMMAGTVLYFRIKTVHLAFLFLIVLGYLTMNSDRISNSIKSNRNDSKKITADLETQAKSITNITNDNSNAERINRWKCAMRMAIQKPLTGFGPGTYQFQYIAFQKPEELTPISVQSPYHIPKGRGGTAHNDLILVLSESGFIAMLIFGSMMLLAIHRGASVFKQMKNTEHKFLLLAVLLGWISYVFHSLFNNFLDTDKAAFLFYAGMAIIVVIDVKYGKENFLKN